MFKDLSHNFNCFINTCRVPRPKPRALSSIVDINEILAVNEDDKTMTVSLHSEHLISGRWKQGLVPKIGKCHLVEMIDTYVSSLQLIGIFSAPPKN